MKEKFSIGRAWRKWYFRTRINIGDFNGIRVLAERVGLNPSEEP